MPVLPPPLQGLFSDPVVQSNIKLAWQIFTIWWWVILPFLFFRPLTFLWLWWRRQVWFSGIKFILLDIRVPRDVVRPLRAMETVFSGLWQLYDPPNPREMWFEGKTLLAYSFELVSIGGEIHFYIRCPEGARKLVETSIYSQYPDVEITLAEDYTKYVPPDVPNKEWDLWGCDYQLMKDDVYPIKTYSKFFEERPDIALEEKRIDPLAQLLEAMATLKPGEQIWVQIRAMPITPLENNYVKRGRAVADKLARRAVPPPQKPLAQEAFEVLVTGKPPGAPQEQKELIPPEMKLTPGEKEILSAVEEKIGKYAFLTNIRFVYVAKRDAYFGPAKALVLSYFSQFSTQNLNALKPWAKTITKVHTIFTWFLDNRRAYLRKRRMFRNYVMRLTPLFPRAGGTFVMNVEELATLFHFPGRAVVSAPFVPRVEVRKGEAPPGLPMES
jgi:hypothetical protein